MDQFRRISSDKYSLTSVSADEYNKVIKINGNDYNLVLAKIIPNATEALKSSPAGVPIISLIVTTGMMERESVVLKKGERKSAGGISIGFESADSADVNISFDGMAFYMSSGIGPWRDEHDVTGSYSCQKRASR